MIDPIIENLKPKDRIKTQFKTTVEIKEITKNSKEFIEVKAICLEIPDQKTFTMKFPKDKKGYIILKHQKEYLPSPQ